MDSNPIEFIISYNSMSEEESVKKLERILLELNKNGLSYLTTSTLPTNLDKFKEAIEYLKQAEKLIG